MHFQDKNESTIFETCTCSADIVRNWVYTISDICCHSFNIKIVSGAHVPEVINKQKK